MIWQLVLGMGCVYAIGRIREGKTYRVKKDFNKVLENIRTQVYNVSGNTYYVKEIIEKPYGFHLTVEIPYGNSYDNFEKLKDVYETNLRCTVEIEKAKNISGAYMKLIYKGFQDKIFEKIETKPYELYLGNDINGKPIISDQTKYPHVVIAGETGGGKSVLMMIMLTNLIMNHSEREINVYITSIAKRDLNDFKYLPQVKGLSRDINDAVAMYRAIEGIMSEREELFDKCKVKNISQYNKKYKNKLPHVYVFTDELSFYMPQQKDSDSVREQKQTALDLLEDFIKRARAVGIYAVAALQVTNANEMPLIIRRQSRTHISFFQKEEVTSRLIIGSDSATTLNPQEAIVMLDYHEYKVKTPEFDTENIDKYIGNLIKKPEVKEEPMEFIHILKCENIPSNMTWKQYLDSKNKVIDYTQKIGQYERGKKKKGVLKDADSK